MLHPTRSGRRAAIRGSAVMLGGLLGTGLLLGGCSSSGAVSHASTEQAQRTVTPTTGETGTTAQATTGTKPPAPGATMPASGGGQEAPPIAGALSGAIVSVAGGSMQVRSGGVASKVMWTADTTFQVAHAAGTKDVRKGTCVVATRGQKVPGSGASGDLVTALVVSDPIGGACVDLRPAVSNARVVSGLVTSVKGATVTLQTKGTGRPTATVKLVLARTIGVAKAGDGSARDAVKARCADVWGMRQTTGAFAATYITISKPGPSGCPA